MLLNAAVKPVGMQRILTAPYLAGVLLPLFQVFASII
jgi:hypothetical protein